MKYNISILFLFILSTSLLAQNGQRKINLFNGKDLNNWDKYLGPAFPGKDSIAKLATPENVYSVVDINGGNVIRISGEVHGSMATKDSFENYHLRMEYKWGEDVTEGRNSGLLYHSYGNFGASYWTWMSSVEFQMMHGSPGDAYMMVEEISAESKVKESGEGKAFFYNPNGKKMSFGENVKRRMIKTSSENEKPLGEWNTLDLYCLGNKSVYVLNGKKVMELNNIGTTKDGVFHSLSQGKIQLQSEGAELFVKNITIELIDRMPETFN